MKDTDKMGVLGSDWKLYIDPAQDVICYHNFLTNEKVLEYKMTDEKLKEIMLSNYYGEARYESVVEAKSNIIYIFYFIYVILYLLQRIASKCLGLRY